MWNQKVDRHSSLCSAGACGDPRDKFLARHPKMNYIGGGRYNNQFGRRIASVGLSTAHAGVVLFKRLPPESLFVVALHGRNHGSVRLSVIPVVVFETELSVQKQNSFSGRLSESPTLEEVRLETCGETWRAYFYVIILRVNIRPFQCTNM